MSEAHHLQLNGQLIKTDAQGYLRHSEQWSEALALVLAEKEGIVLEDPHWEVVRFVRAFYLEFNTSPAIRALVKAMEKQYGPEKGNSRYLYKLFPEGPAKRPPRSQASPSR